MVDVRDLWLAHCSGLTWRQVGERFGISPSAARGRVRRAKDAGILPAARREAGVTVSENDGGLVVESEPGRRIRTLEQLLEACGINPEKWEIKGKVNKWDSLIKSADGEPIVTELYQVTAWLTPLKPYIDAEAAIKRQIADMAKHAPRYKAVRYPSIPRKDRHLLELFVADHHIGLLAWGKEADDDYDSDIAEEILRYGLDYIMARVQNFPLDKILLPLGNDWLHTDQTLEGKGGTTSKGTPQDVDTRWQKMFRRARRLAVDMIDELRLIAPVEVIIVPGNHDRERMFFLGDSLQAWYRADRQVTIRNDAKPRHYFQYGVNLIGLAHGHETKLDKLPIIMATEAPDMWSDTIFREFHIGHTHAKREIKYVEVDEEQGVRVRVMPSLVARDAWHAQKGYRHTRAMEAYLWHVSRGYVGHFSVAVPEHLRGELVEDK